MMRYLIYGDAEAGKTTTCHIIMKALLSLGGVMRRFETISSDDFSALLEFYGLNVGIYAAGENNEHLRNAFEMVEETECDILIATVRRRIKYGDILAPFKEGVDFEWHTLNNPITKADHARLCNSLAMEIISEINKQIK